MVGTQFVYGAAGLLQLEQLHLGWCSSIGDEDMKGLQTLTRLSDLQLSRTKVCCEFQLVLQSLAPTVFAHWPASDQLPS